MKFPKHPTGALLVAVLALAAWSQRTSAADAASAAAQAEASQAAAAADTERQLAEAQRQLEESARRVAELSSQLGGRLGGPNFLFSRREGIAPRAVIGVQLAPEEGQGGAKVMEVSPGGPAAVAGIKAGDVITSIGGQDLAREANPGRTLVEKMREINPDLKVQVGVLRDGKKMNFDVTPRPAPQVMAFEGGRRIGGGPGPMPGPGARVFNLPGPPGPGAAGGPGEVRRFILNRSDEGGMGVRFHGMEFATLSERLGSYFGVKAGVLVVRAGSNPAFKLQDGDVIIGIDGREPSSAQHAGRILRSYQPGEKLTIRVQRDRKAQNLEVTAPGGGGED